MTDEQIFSPRHLESTYFKKHSLRLDMSENDWKRLIGSTRDLTRSIIHEHTASGLYVEFRSSHLFSSIFKDESVEYESDQLNILHAFQAQQIRDFNNGDISKDDFSLNLGISWQCAIALGQGSRAWDGIAIHCTPYEVEHAHQSYSSPDEA